MTEHIEVVYNEEYKQEDAAASQDEQLPDFNEVAEKVLQEDALNRS